MALPILDGNQTAATLSTIVTGGQHIPAHTVVSLGSQAITDMRSAVSGSVVSISNFPSTQTIAGTVTANDSGALTIVNSSTVTKTDVKFTAIAGAYNPTDFSGNYTLHPINIDNDGIIFVDGQYVNYRGTCVTYNPSSAETAWKAKLVESSVTVGNSVTVGSLPLIAGTVTANVFGLDYIGQPQPLPIETDSNVIGDKFIPIGFNNDGDARQVSNNTPLPIQAPSPIGISGTVTANNPSGALTTRFGSVTTANTAQITSAVTNTSRKYLLAQNISAGTVTIGIGFSPTTTQGIQLTAGGGLTFDAFCPTGAVYWLGAVTGAAFTILEG